MRRLLLLFSTLVLSCLATTQQDVLDMIAASVNPSCIAPQIVNCGGKCYGSESCNEFILTVNSQNSVIALFDWMFKTNGIQLFPFMIK